MTDQQRPNDRPENGPYEGTGEAAPTERLDAARTERVDPARTERLDAASHERLGGRREGEQPPPGQAPVTPEPDRVPERPRGPHAPTILLALICLAVAGLAIARQVTGFIGLTWTGSGPAIIVGAGVVLLAVGVLGLVRDRRDPHQR